MKLLRLLLLCLLLPLGSGMAGAQAVVSRDAMTHFFDANTGDLRAELADARADGKKGILLMYEQEGCPACLYMKQNVLNRSDVQTLYRKHFVNFTIDLFGAVPLKDFRGRDVTEKAFAAEARVRATPTFRLSRPRRHRGGAHHRRGARRRGIQAAGGIRRQRRL